MPKNSYQSLVFNDVLLCQGSVNDCYKEKHIGSYNFMFIHKWKSCQLLVDRVRSSTCYFLIAQEWVPSCFISCFFVLVAGYKLAFQTLLLPNFRFHLWYKHLKKSMLGTVKIEFYRILHLTNVSPVFAIFSKGLFCSDISTAWCCFQWNYLKVSLQYLSQWLKYVTELFWQLVDDSEIATE